ncbi:hypothetical protein GSbR_22710 [Geobacter sp. SVR]|nr:hypothetical protein GSbR_22710 [Geobacter sp. SVR]
MIEWAENDGEETMNELIFMLLFFGTPGIIGFVMAKRRGKNPFLWGVLCGVLPFFLMVLKMQFKLLDKPKGPQSP